jgi:hypothetical protein
VLGWGLRVAGAGEAPERSTIDALVQWLATGRESRRTAHGAIVSARRHVIEIMREPGRIRERFAAVGESGQRLFDGRFLVVAPADAQVGPMGPKPALKRPKDVPNLAFEGLPLVKLAGGELVSAVRSTIPGISATLCERFSL